MIRVTIDAIRDGSKERSTIQTIDISNDSTYRATGSINKTGRIDKFPRAIGAVRLALMVLKEAVK